MNGTNYNSDGGFEEWQVRTYPAPNTPSVSTTLSNTGPVLTGTSVHDSATINGATSTAGGTISYGLYSDSTCSTLVQDLTPTTNTVVNGVAPDSNSYTFNSAGTFYFQATYSGDANNTGPVSSPCTSETLVVVVPGQPTIVKTVNGSSSTGITGGQTTTLTYTITVTNPGTAPTQAPYILADDAFPTFFNETSISCKLNGVTQTCSYADLTSSGIYLGTLAPSDTWLVTVIGTATPNTTSDLGSHTNTAEICPVESETCTPSSATVNVSYTPPNSPLSPKIAITKVANPTQLGVGGGSVTYTYTVTNAGSAPLSNVTVTDNKCAPVTYVSGDTNSDKVLETTETWTYTCTTTITQTTTNTATATGSYNGVTVTATAQAVVTVAPPTPTPSPTGAVAGATGTPSLPPTTSLPGQGGGPNGTILLLLGALGAASLALISLTLLRERLLDSVDR